VENIAHMLGFIILPLIIKQRVRREMGTLENIFSCVRNFLTDFLNYPTVCASWRMAQMLMQKLYKLPPVRGTSSTGLFRKGGKEKNCIFSFMCQSQASGRDRG